MLGKFFSKMTYGQDILLLSGLIILATLFNSNWAFSPLEILPVDGTYNDQWSYVGTMLDLSDKLNFVADTYANHAVIQNHGYIFERFSWSIPGGIVYQAFPPIIANYLLKLAVYSMAVIGTYWALRNLFGRRTGLFAGLCLGGYAWFLRSAGWDYVDGIGMGYFSMTFALMVGAIYARKKITWMIACFLTGAMVINLLISNFYWAFFVPHFLIIAVWLNQRRYHRSLLISLFFGILGGSLMVFIYAFISYTIRGEWFFLQLSTRSTRVVMLITKNFWRTRNFDLYNPMIAHYHVIPLLLLSSGIFILRKKRPNKTLQQMLLLQLLWIYGVFAVLHFYVQPYLIMSIYSSYLIPAVFLWLGGMVAPRIESLSAQQFRYVLIGIIVLFLAPFALSALFPIFEIWQNNTILLALCVLILVGSLLWINKIRLVLLFGSIILFGWMSSSQIYVFGADRLQGQETFAMAFDAYEAIENHYTNNGIRDVQFIYDPRNTTDVPMVVPAMFYFDANYLRPVVRLEEEADGVIISKESLVDDIFNRITMGQESQKTVIMTRFPDTLDRLINGYMENRDYEVEKTIKLERHGMVFYIHFLTIMP
ncbi:MAG: hypothetical protein SFZ02_16000 [bacterium]|nr:hypothetical protein [bacterium]